MRRAKKGVGSGRILALVFSCALSLSPAAWSQGPAPQTTPQPAAATVPAYRLEPGDQIEIRFFYNPELNDKVDIRPEGAISMPLIGQVQAAGKTVEELTNELQELYKNTLREPAVTVQIRSYAGRKFIVGGDVLRPGVFPLIGSQTVLGAVMEAGGFKPTSSRDSVLLVRKTSADTPQILRISFASSGNQPSQAALTPIQPYDVVLVSESGVSKANRFVEQYITKMMPFIVTAGFTYLIRGTVIE